MKRFPKFLYVAVDRDGEYLGVNTNLSELKDDMNDYSEAFSITRFEIVGEWKNPKKAKP